jgi:hypothetical protein
MEWVTNAPIERRGGLCAATEVAERTPVVARTVRRCLMLMVYGSPLAFRTASDSYQGRWAILRY